MSASGLSPFLLLACLVATTPFQTVPDFHQSRGIIRKICPKQMDETRWQRASRRWSFLMQASGADEDRRRLEMAYLASVGDSEHFHLFSFQPPPSNLCEIADDAINSPSLSATLSGRLQKLPIWTSSVQVSGLDMSSRKSGSAELMTKGEVMLPGLQTILVTQDPRQVYMFEELVARCAPHFFGAVLLEDHQEEVHLENASGNVGTLMEVASCKRLADGRLLLHVLGICRIRMDEVNQTAPYVRADCVVLPDEEEIQFLLTTGTGQVMAKVRKLEALSQDVLATLEDGYFQRASLMVAREAAAAWSLAWRSYEAPLQIAALALRKSTESGNLGDIVPVNLGSQPEDTMYRAQAAASQAALLYTAEALELVGYRPMMREYQGPMMQLTDELMPPSWLEVIDHFATRTSAEDRQEGLEEEQEGVEEDQAHDTWADERIKMELEKREVVVIKGEYSEGVFEGRLSNRSVRVIELKEGRFSAEGGGKWGGQMHGRGAGIVEETLVQKELKIWSALQEIVDLRRSLSSANGKEEGGRGKVKQIKKSAVDGGAGVHLEEDRGGVSRSEVGEGGEVSAGDEELVLEWEVPVELRQMHPAIAHPSWPAVRRVQRLSYVVPTILHKLLPLQYAQGHRLLLSHSIHERLDLVQEALQDSIRRLSALSDLHLAKDQGTASRGREVTERGKWRQLWYDYTGAADDEDLSPGATG